MNPLTDAATIRAMRVYGGDFVAALGNAALYADEENLRRIKYTWPEYWQQYTEMAKAEKTTQHTIASFLKAQKKKNETSTKEKP